MILLNRRFLFPLALALHVDGGVAIRNRRERRRGWRARADVSGGKAHRRPILFTTLSDDERFLHAVGFDALVLHQVEQQFEELLYEVLLTHNLGVPLGEAKHTVRDMAIAHRTVRDWLEKEYAGIEGHVPFEKHLLVPHLHHPFFRCGDVVKIVNCLRVT